MTPSDHVVILCTCPDIDTATELANHLVDNGLAACVNLVPGLTSIYRWQGKREQGNEILLLIKTRTPRYQEVEDAIVSMHPYELPEVIAVPIAHGLPAYLSWIDNTTGNK